MRHREGDASERGHGRGRREEPPAHRGARGSHGGHGARGAQTFRRGRVLLFLEQLKVRRNTLANQLVQSEFESIRPMLSGELKALDHVIEDYVHLFDLQEIGEEPRSEDAADEGEGNV